MRDIIVAYPIKDTALKLRSLLEREGFHVSHICALGSSVLSISQELREGVIISAAVLSDMSAANIAEHLPTDFDIVALTKGGMESYMGNLISMPLPLKRAEFIETISILANSTSSFTKRNKADSDLIHDAKLILMNVRDITESQAHKYLQQESMKTGKRLVELARQIINDFNFSENDL